MFSAFLLLYICKLSKSLWGNVGKTNDVSPKKSYNYRVVPKQQCQPKSHFIELEVIIIYSERHEIKKRKETFCIIIVINDL